MAATRRGNIRTGDLMTAVICESDLKLDIVFSPAKVFQIPVSDPCPG